MPRPKVRPEDRQRSSRACTACKASKIRCDSQSPCAACVRRERGAFCMYQSTRRFRRRYQGSVHDSNFTDTTGASPTRRDSYRESTPIVVAAQRPSSAIAMPRPPPGCSPQSPVNPPSPSSATAVESETGRQLPKGRLLISSTGEKVYIGETASLSFLHFLRQALKPFVGSMPFTDANRHNVMLEANLNEFAGRDQLHNSPDERDALLTSYLEATSGLFDFFTASELRVIMAECDQPNTADISPKSAVKGEDQAALDMALAIGAQARAATPDDTQLAAAYFNRARKAAFEGMLAHPSLGMVRLFTLLAFYMLGACQRNAAFMYLGVASKAAVVLGMHQDVYHRSLDRDEFALRLRAWKSLRILDTLTSFILGRPSSLPVLRYDTSELCDGGKKAPDQQNLAFNTISRACTLLEEIVQKINHSNMLDIPTAEGLLDKLRQWSQNLPSTLRRCSATTSPGLAGFQTLLGNMHVSCVYYFAVMLITRPFLIAHHLPALRGKVAANGANDGRDGFDGRSEKAARLAQVCVSSAMYMADTFQQVKESGYTFGNLCLVKAWVFGAGLVLGFSLFASEPRGDVRVSFDAAREVLRSLSAASPQARLYLDILNDFSDSIAQYHRRLSSEARRSVHQYIDQILVADDTTYGRDGTDVGQQHYPSPKGSRDIDAFTSGQTGQDSEMFDMGNMAAGESGLAMLEDFQGWDDIMLRLSDNFSLNYYPQ